MKTKKFKSTLVLFVLGLAVVFTVNYALADWTPPTSTPPSCPAGQPGCDVPINVGTVDQVKNGGLSVNAFSAYMNAWFEQKVSIKGTIGGATGTPANPGVATLEVTTPLKVDNLANSTAPQPVCANADGTLQLCNQSGFVQVASQYGLAITAITGIPGFTLPYTVTGSTQVGNGTHGADGSFATAPTSPGDIILTIKGNPAPVEDQTVTLNIYDQTDPSKVLFSECAFVSKTNYDTFRDPQHIDFPLTSPTDTNTYTTQYQQNPGFSAYQDISIVASGLSGTQSQSSCALGVE